MMEDEYMKLHQPPLNEPRVISKQTAEGRDLQPLHKPRSNDTLEFHLRVGAPDSTSVLVRVDATSQRRAEQFAQAWASARWFKDRRQASVYETVLVD